MDLLWPDLGFLCISYLDFGGPSPRGARPEIPPTLGGGCPAEPDLYRVQGPHPIRGMALSTLDEPAQPVLGEERT